jgi:hypothetical protein
MGILLNGYGPPSQFCYDFLCADEPIMVSDIPILILFQFCRRIVGQKNSDLQSYGQIIKYGLFFIFTG